MNPDADLTPSGIAALIADFLEALDLEDVTIVGNDSGGAMSQVLVTPPPGADRPPGADQLRHPRELPAGDVQGDAAAGEAARRDVALAAPFRIAAIARPAFKPFAKTKIPDELIASWMAPGEERPGRAAGRRRRSRQG